MNVSLTSVATSGRGWITRTRSATAALVLVSAVAYLVAYVLTALVRIRYPFELEWMEGGMVEHVRRLLAGQPIYAKPSLEFVSFLYPPLYYAVAAGVSRLTGIGFLPLRLVSFASSVGVLALLFAIVRRESGSNAAGIVAAGLFIATYDRTSRWLDLARLDSFYLLLLLAAVLTLRAVAGARGAVIAGVLTGAAYVTKQSALVVCAPLVVAAAVCDVRRAVWYLASAAAIIGASTLALQLASDGWFAYYCFTIPLHHPHITGGWKTFWPLDVLRPVGGTFLMALAYLPLARRLREPIGDRLFHLAFAVGTIASAWLVRSEVGADVNNLLPAYASLSILAGIASRDLQRLARQAPSSWTVIALGGELLLLVQLARLHYDPRRAMPTAADRAAGAAVVARIANVDGEVYFPHHGYLARMAGKREFAHTLAMDNIFLDDDGPAMRDLQKEMTDASETRRFAAVVMEADRRYEDVFGAAYPRCERLVERPDVFWPVAGAPIRPESICFPKR
jgi:hypothetical protein